MKESGSYPEATLENCLKNADRPELRVKYTTGFPPFQYHFLQMNRPMIVFNYRWNGSSCLLNHLKQQSKADHKTKAPILIDVRARINSRYVRVIWFGPPSMDVNGRLIQTG